MRSFSQAGKTDLFSDESATDNIDYACTSYLNCANVHLLFLFFKLNEISFKRNIWPVHVWDN